MQKLVKRISLVMVALMTVFTALSYMPAKAATVVPKVQFVGEQKLEYTAGDRVTFNLNASNYGGRVQYRVVLWNDSTKSYKDLWNTADKYYTNWMPYGNETLPLGWPITEPGTYRITVYAKRAGLANSKTALKGMNCDSYLNGPAFVVKPAAAAPESIAPVADVTVNEGEKAVLPETVTINLADKTTKTAKVTWAAVDTTKVGTVAVEGTVEGTDKKASVNVVVKAVALDATVSTNNLKEIVVKFNKAVDKTTATNVNNYKLNDAVIEKSASASLLEDGKTVVINLRSYLTNLVNQKSYKLTVNVEGLNKTFDFTPLDVTVPSVEKVEAVGMKTINVTFSEPVDPNTALTRANYKLNGYVVNGELKIDKNNKVVTITLYSLMKAGENKLSVTGVKDFAAMTIVNYLDQPFTVVDDSTAPASLTVDSATLEYVDVTFNEAVDSSTVEAAYIYWSDDAGVTKHYATDAYALDTTYTKYEFDFTGDRLPAKSTTLYVEKVSDMSENEVAKLTTVVTATVDTERPDVISVDFAKDPSTGLYYVGNDKLEVKFNKTVATTQLEGDNAENLTVKDSTGKVVAVAQDADYKVVNNVTLYDTMVVTLSAALSDSKTYTVELADIVDNTILANKMIPEKFTVVGLAQTLPEVDNVFVYQTLGESTRIQVVFTNEMTIAGEKSILDRTKYMMEIGGHWYPIPSTASLEPTYNNMAVVITIPDEAKYDGTNEIVSASISNVKVTYVADKNGNLLAGFTAEEPVSGVTAAVMLPHTDADYYPVATAKDTIVVTFDRPLQYVSYKDFTVTDSGTTYTVTKALYETVDGKGVVTLKLSSDTKLPADPETNTLTVTTVAAANIKSVDILGNKIEDAISVNVVDEIAPSLIATDPVVFDNGTATKDRILVKFDEPLKTNGALDPQAIAASFTVTYGYNNKLLVPGVDYVADIDGGDASIVNIDILKTGIAGQTIKVATNSNYVVLYDNADASIVNCNKISFTTKTVKNGNLIDTLATTTTIPSVTGTNSNATKLVITLSEALYNPTGHVAYTEGADVSALVTGTAAGANLASAVYNLAAKTVTITLTSGATNGQTLILAGEDSAQNSFTTTYSYTAANTVWE